MQSFNLDDAPQHVRLLVKDLMAELRRVKKENLSLRKELKNWAMSSDEFKNAAFTVTIRDE